MTSNWKGFCCGNRAPGPPPLPQPPTETTGNATGTGNGARVSRPAGSVSPKSVERRKKWTRPTHRILMKNRRKQGLASEGAGNPGARTDAKREQYEAPEPHPPRPERPERPTPAAAPPKVILVTGRYPANREGNAVSVIA